MISVWPIVWRMRELEDLRSISGPTRNAYTTGYRNQFLPLLEALHRDLTITNELSRQRVRREEHNAWNTTVRLTYWKKIDLSIPNRKRCQMIDRLTLLELAPLP